MNTRLTLLCLFAVAAFCLDSCATGNADTITPAQLARIDRVAHRGKRPAEPAIVYTVEEIRTPNGRVGVESAEIILRDHRNPQNPALRIPYNPDKNTLPFTPIPGQNVTLYLDNQNGEMRALFP